MSANIYLNLLFLYGVLCQGIIGTLSEKDIDKENTTQMLHQIPGETSELLIRQKRVINRDNDVRVPIKNVPYIVFIREIRSENHCPGTVLTRNIVITAAKCMTLNNVAYTVFSATSRIEYGSRSTIHSVTDKRSFHGIHPFRTEDGISLITVNPPFDFGSRSSTRSIPIFEGHLRPGTLATVSGWGCDEGGEPGTAHPKHLRSITVPIISIQECTNIFLRIFAITEADICTLDRTGQQYCGVNDAGAPLTVQVNHVIYLAGIHLWNGGIVGRDNPDVFINLQDRWYKPWITENIRSMEANIRPHSPHIHG